MSCNDTLEAARTLRPALSWCIDDEGNASGDDGELTITVYALGDAYMVCAQAVMFVIATATADTLREALDELDQKIAQAAASPDSMLAVVRKLKGMRP